MLKRSSIATIPMLLLCLLATAAGRLPADTLSHALKASLSASANKLMQEVFKPHGKALVEYNGFDAADDLQQQYVNGAVPLYDNTVKEKLITSIKSFNTANSSKKTKLYAFTGRYFLGYTDFMRREALPGYEKKIMDALTKGLQKETGGKGNTEVFRKTFLKVLDDKYQEFIKKSDDLQIEKTIVFFYVEAVLGMDNLSASDLKTTYKKRRYCFLWTKGLDVFETQKLNKAFPEFRQLLTFTKEGIANPGGLVACTDKINSLYKSAADYDSPKEAIHLVWTLNAEEISALTVAERMRLLRAMDKASSLTDVNNVFSLGSDNFGGEQAAIKVITTVGDNNSKDWMDSLQANPKLVVSLLDKLNDAGIGGSNYTKAVFSILGHFYKNVAIEANKDKFKDNFRTFAFNGFGLWDGSNYTIFEYPASGTIGGVIHTNSGVGYKEYAYGPFDQVAILSSTELPGLKYKEKVGGKHYLAVVPSFYLSWAHHTKQNANSWQMGGIAVLVPFNALMFGTGMTMVGSASWIVRTLGYMDIVASTGSTVLSTTPIKDRIKEKYGENSTQYKMINGVDKAFMIYGASRLIIDLAGIPQYLDEAAVIWKAERQAMQEQAAITKKEAEALDRLLAARLTAADIVKNGMKDGWTIERVLSFPKGKRPPPTEYLKPEYIAAHLKEFEEGVSFICPQGIIDDYGSKLGRADGVYVISTKRMEELMATTKGDMALIEKELAIPEGDWQSRVMCRVDVKLPKDFDLRMPSGNEEGANEFFKPGGFTANGVPEAVINPIPAAKYTFKAINPGAAAKEATSIVQKGMKDGWTIERVLAKPHGQRELATVYMTDAYIAAHLKKFEDGVAFICPRRIIKDYGSKLGYEDGVYVTTTKKMNELLATAKGDMTVIEDALAVPRGRWSTQEMCVVYVPKPKDLNLRMPSGNEKGANEFFKPGGFTANGKIEAVIDPIPEGQYTFKPVNYKE